MTAEGYCLYVERGNNEAALATAIVHLAQLLSPLAFCSHMIVREHYFSSIQSLLAWDCCGLVPTRVLHISTR